MSPSSDPSMQVVRSIAALFVAALAGPGSAFGGIDSQARALVESVPAPIGSVFACGVWAERGERGRYRVVLAEASGGAGTEVYLQQIRETTEAGHPVLRVVSTTPIRELNNDHAQYQVTSARCSAGKTVELEATYEHDEGDLRRRVRLVPTPSGYTIRIAIVQPGKRRR